MTAAASSAHLRRDVGIADAGHDISGEPGIVLHDPLRHRFFRLPASVQPILDGQAAMDKALQDFLEQNRLTETSAGLWEKLLAEQQRRHTSVASKVLHNYVSFRIPLFRPERFLDATLPWVRPLASRPVFFVLLSCFLFGGYFALRQWDQFVAMLWSSFTLAGAFSYGATLVALKVLHELGHAYVARHIGCRVPSIGVAFMLLTPMLYTDASDAWCLASRRQRFLIGAAGVLVEMAIASVALLCWAFLPDGPWRALSFFVAVSAWVASLLVNLSPFMRFDGYHMLADAMGMHSLGPRSFALATWRLREILFKPDAPPPELFPVATARLLVAYAICTWVYRLTLFLGIAWLLYTTLPKAAGLPLALVEVWFFILLPIKRELKGWSAMGFKTLFSTPRGRLTTILGVTLLVLAALPLDRHVHVPAVMLPASEARIFAPEPAHVLAVMVRPGDIVQAGDLMARLFVPDIPHLQRSAQLRHDLAAGRLQRIAADAKDRAEVQVLEQKRQTALSELEGLRKRGRLLEVRAPIAGQVMADAATLRVGQWIGREDLLFQVVDGRGARLVGLLLERESGRVALGAEVQFIPADGLGAARSGQVTSVGLPGSEGQAKAYLSSQFGGAVAVDPATGDKPTMGYLPLQMALEGPAWARAMSGTAVVRAESQSVLAFMAGRFATVFLRESGF